MRIGFLAGRQAADQIRRRFSLAPRREQPRQHGMRAGGSNSAGSRKKLLSLTVMASVTASASASRPSRSSLDQRRRHP